MPISAEIWTVVGLSLKVAFMAMLIALPLATAMAYLLATRKFPGWSLLNALCHLPLVLPPVITGYGLLKLFQPNGFVGQLLHDAFGITVAFQWTGAAIAAAVMAFPLIMRPIRLAFELQDPDGLDLAKSLGAGRVTGFLTISLPLALPGLIAGAVLGFAKSMGEFGATITFVSNIPGETQTIALAVYSFLQSPSGDYQATVLIVIGLVISLLAILVSEWVASRMSGRGALAHA